MKRKKTLKELTLKDNFMFGAVMSDETNCRRLLELILQFPIERVEVSKEKSIIYHPEYKGIRMDVYAKDGNNTHYNVEMQTVQKCGLGMRTRYYHSQLDMELLLQGEEYSKLPNTYVIFICDFDPFGKKKYCYTFENMCREVDGLLLKDGSKSIFLSTCGTNVDVVPDAMVKFLNYVKADLKDCTKDFEDEFVQSLQLAVQNIKESREMEERFMILHEMLQEEREEGREEGRTAGKVEAILELLQELGEFSDELQTQIESEKDSAVLTRWLKLAAKAESLEHFQQNM